LINPYNLPSSLSSLAMPYFNNDTELTAEWDFVNQDGDSVCYIASKIKNPQADHSLLQTSRRSRSSSCGSQNIASVPQLPAAVKDLLANVSRDGYPEQQDGIEKTQPWKKVWDGIVEPVKPGELLIACPKKSDHGK
jgi:hypothetical protein